MRLADSASQNGLWACRRKQKASGIPEALRLNNAVTLGFLYFSALQTGSANAHTAVRTLHNRAYGTQIHVPAPLSHIMGVADIVSKLRPFAAHFAYSCHLANSRIDRLMRAFEALKSRKFLQKACSTGSW